MNMLEKLKSLRKVMEKASTSNVPEEGFHVIIQGCKRLFDCDKAVFLLNEPRGDFLRIKSAVGVSQNFINSFEVKKDSKAQSELLSQKKGLVLTRGESPPELIKAFTLESAFTYAFIQPVYSFDRTFGYFQCEKNDVPFGEENLEILQLFARAAGTLLAHNEYCERLKLLESADEELGILTSNRFFEKLDEELKRCKRYKKNAAIMLFHLDAHAEYIRYHGFEAGRRLLRVLADVVKGNIRDNDFISRYGIETLAICLIEVDEEASLNIGSRIIQAFLHSNVQHKEPEIKMSIGIAHTLEAGYDFRKVLSCARSALLQSQIKGKNRTALYKQRV